MPGLHAFLANYPASANKPHSRILTLETKKSIFPFLRKGDGRKKEG